MAEGSSLEICLQMSLNMKHTNNPTLLGGDPSIADLRAHH